jgi:hypothetical protein
MILVISLAGIAYVTSHISGNKLIISFASLHFFFTFAIFPTLNKNGRLQHSQEFKVPSMIACLVIFLLILPLQI